MSTQSMLDELGISWKEKDKHIHATIYDKSYRFALEMDSSDFAKQIGLDNRFGSHKSDVTTESALISIRSEYANTALKNGRTGVILNPDKDYYYLDYEGYTVKLYMSENAMAVNMVDGDGGNLSLGFNSKLTGSMVKRYILSAISETS